VVVHYGFAQTPNIPVALKLCKKLGIDIDLDNVTYYLGHEEIVPKRSRSGRTRLRTQLFAFLWRNAARVTSFYNIPAERAVVVGVQVEM
jgi:KUP system potassium uptake protein